MIKSFLKLKKGFTLVELLVVVAIIGLIITAAVLSLENSKQKSRDAKRISDVENLKMAIELYSHANGLGLYPAASRWSDLQTALNVYINNLPLPPTINNVDYYFYSYSDDSNNPAFYVGAILEDGNHSALNNDNDDATLFTTVVAVDGAGNNVSISGTCQDNRKAYCFYVE